MEHLVGQRLGKYQILEEIGRGGMGIVYKCLDPLLNRYVAIKVLAPHLIWEKDFVQRFLREAQVAAQLRHANIVTIHEVGQEGNLYYFVMEYIPGQSLTEIIAEKGALSLKQALQIAGQVAAALDYAHARGLVHRDIKSSNIVLDDQGQAVLTDFGIVRAAEGTRLTSTGATMGTPEYMSPEQARGEEATASCDIYSLGIVVYEMLSGEVPFSGTTPLAILMKQATEEPPPLRQRNPKVPEGVEQVVMQTLHKDPQARPDSASALVTALRNAIEGRPTKPPATLELPKRPPPKQTVPKRKRPSKDSIFSRIPIWGWAGISVAAVVLIIGLSWTLRQRSIEEAERTPTPVPTVIAAAATATPFPSAIPSPLPTPIRTPSPSPVPPTESAPTAAPEARVVSSVANLRAGPGMEYEIVGQLAEGAEVAVLAQAENEQGEIWLLVPHPQGGEAWVSSDLVETNVALASLPPAETVPPAPTLEPTAVSAPRCIAFVSSRDGNDEIYVMGADGSNPTRLTNNSSTDFLPAWSPAGSRIAFVSDRDGNNEIYAMNADGSGQVRLTYNAAHDGRPTWSADGSRIAFHSDRDGNWNIYVMNADGSSPVLLTDNGTYDAWPAWSPDGGWFAFSSDRNGNIEIYVMSVDGSSVSRLTHNAAYDLSPSWSRGGSWIAFISDRSGNDEIYVMSVDGSSLYRLTNNPGDDMMPTWSPDGSRIAFMSQRTGNWEIYTINVDGSNQVPLTSGQGESRDPAWSPVCRP